MGVNKRSLKNLIIIPSFQARVVFMMILGGTIFTAFNAGLFYYYVNETYYYLSHYHGLTDSMLSEKYIDLYELGLTLLIVSLICMLTVAIWSLIITHRAAGPLFQFKQVFESIKGGDHQARIRLRKKDHFQDVAKSFNEMMDRIEKNS